jgi:TonB-dependent receptor
MIRKALSLIVVGLGLIALAPAAFAQTVTGEITDEQKTVSFQGAVVRIEGLAGSATSDDRGRFRFTNVAAGNYTLVVSYVGTAETRVSIDVPDVGVNLGEIAIGVNTQSDLEEVIVVGQAAAIASALNQERSADNLVSVLDTDAMGQFPDQNVAESLRRLTGVSVENDQGEGRYVVIRGMDPDLNATSINGVRATAAEPRRALQLDVIPSDVLDGLEVHKTLSADMDGDAIGGSINIKTLSAFSRKGPYLKARVEGGYNELREKWSPKASVAGSNIFELSGDRRLGIAGAVSMHDRQLLVNNMEMDGWDVSDNGNDYADELQSRLYTVDRERLGGALNFDLDMSERTSLHLYTLYSKFNDTELRNRTEFGFDDLDEDTVTASNADYAITEVARDTKDREQSAENLSISFGSETQYDTWLIETNFGYNYAVEKTPDQVEAAWEAEFESDDGFIDPDSPAASINLSNPELPVVESGFWSALQDPSLFELDEIERGSEKNEDTQLSFRFDATKETGFGSIKFGVKSRLREKKTNETVDLWSNDDMWFMSDVPNPDGGLEYGFPTPVAPIPDAAAIRDILASGDGLEYEDNDSIIGSNVADFVFDEDVLAAYLMGKWESERATFIAGVRYEKTDIDNRGNEVEFIEEGTDVGGIPLPDDEVFITAVQRKSSYDDVLPSASIRFEFSDTLIGRASFHKSVVRPGIESVAFRLEIEDNEAELGNPDLKPFRAWNADVSVSYYPTELSVISAGVFYKTIEDFIFLQEIEDFEWEGRTFSEAVIALNGEDATVLGFEFTYQQHFGFLGAPWDAFMVAVNYTYVDSEGDTGDRKVDLPKQSANIGSFMIGYDKHGFDLRLAMKYRDRYIDELVDADYDRYTGDHLQWDLTAKYRFSENWQVYAEVANLGDEPELYYAGNSSRLYQHDNVGTTSAIGVQYNFQ